MPASYSRVSEIVLAGMGGSALPAHLVQSVYGGALRVPFYFTNGYGLPGSVGKNSVVIAASYSGTTEETLSCLAEAKKRGAKVMGLTSGGPLAAAVKRMGVPAYVFNPVHNPCRQPRLGLGYMTAGLLALLEKIQRFGLSLEELSRLPAALRSVSKKWSLSSPMQKNAAKIMAHGLDGKVPVIVSAEHLVGNGHVFQNQVHESPKQFCAAFPLPELNHHLMEGLKFPAPARSLLSFVFLGSGLYGKRLAKRMEITAQVVEKQGYDAHVFRPSSKTKLTQAFETLAFGSYASFYMAMQNRVNPSDIPWVDFFKKELARG